ncbi:hypothetical protein PPL_03286 [Heterostelium album PN500]|uniref:Uncharacterized protein n=1 Tax=Heterostelium pallidum (strain ATCC 26659 / Pp 5 / PN500) TaxID=670386 RepID=D3B4G2_HETP5|nr:hypothetical protein PPL_03286 [Heterostelium album PN500]EFA84210.1 hypothetical protein PPL_03286 [Heterostelium album PN500]|eukprot:XP_020436326.1 hypothetical protein PPL_03286 [Heterostelium album PN500]
MSLNMLEPRKDEITGYTNAMISNTGVMLTTAYAMHSLNSSSAFTNVSTHNNYYFFIFNTQTTSLYISITTYTIFSSFIVTHTLSSLSVAILFLLIHSPSLYPSILFFAAFIMSHQQHPLFTCWVEFSNKKDELTFENTANYNRLIHVIRGSKQLAVGDGSIDLFSDAAKTIQLDVETPVDRNLQRIYVATTQPQQDKLLTINTFSGHIPQHLQSPSLHAYLTLFKAIHHHQKQYQPELYYPSLINHHRLSLSPKKKSFAFSDITQAKWESIIDFTGINFKEEVIRVSPDKLQQEEIEPFVWNPNLNEVDQMGPALQWLKTNIPLPASLETPLISSIWTEGYTRLCSRSSRDQTLSDSAVLGL